MSYRVNVLGTDQAFEVNEDESILDGALRANVKMAHECQFGGCGTCRIKLESGSVRYDEFPMALTDEEAAQGYALACQARPVSDVTVSAAKKGPTFAEPSRLGATLSAVQPLSSDIVHLTLELPANTPLNYRPGQYMNILLDDGTSRSFSMASSTVSGNSIDFHVRQIPGGHFTQGVLTTLPTGTALNIEMPLGTFCYHEDDWRPLVMVANGTGLAPIKAILESLLDNEDCPPVSLYWGMRTEEELYLRDEIASWKDRLYEFNFVPVLSKGSPQWEGRRGYVQQAVAEDLSDLSEHAIYLCGSPNMIADAKSLFAQHGADLDYMYADSFTFQYQTEAAA